MFVGSDLIAIVSSTSLCGCDVGSRGSSSSIEVAEVDRGEEASSSSSVSRSTNVVLCRALSRFKSLSFNGS